MAFEAKNFVLCSKFNLFKAHCNLWIYATSDTLEDCLTPNYFQPRRNLKNQDSPEVGDVIQLIVEGSKLAYLKITAKTEKPYNITVARTFLENEAALIADITALQLEKASKDGDFVTEITEENLGITQAEQTELEQKIDTAANSGRMITPQGFWYAKMYAGTTAPSADNGTNYADFSQVDGEGNPIIVTYNRTGGVWVQDQTITPPADYDGYVPITSKIWDIAEQDGQQGGRVLWNHTSKQFTPYPNIVSFDSIEITGDSTVEMPVNPTNDNIANVGFVKNTIGTARNIGDIFYTSRKESTINGAVRCDGSVYQTTDFSGSQSIGQLLALGKIPYISMADWTDQLSHGNVGVFGWDGVGTTAFRVPFLETAYLSGASGSQYSTRHVGDYIHSHAPNITGEFDGIVEIDAYGSGETNPPMTGTGALKNAGVSTATSHVTSTQGSNRTVYKLGLDASLAPNTHNIYKNGVEEICPETILYYPMVQLAVGSTDEALETCTSVLSDIAGLKDNSNLTSVGKNIANWSSNVSNCIAQIPQNINVTLSSGTLTLKSGSKLYVPNGVGVFDEITLTADKTATQTANDTRMYFYNGSYIEKFPLAQCYSGDTAPSGQTYMFWYDTANNLMKMTTDGGTTWTSGWSLPFCIATASGGALTSIDQVFNGFGYIGSTIFMLPGVTLVKPNGRNADGTLKNTVSSVSAVRTNSTVRPGVSGYLIYAPAGQAIQKSAAQTNWTYDETNNYVRSAGGDTSWMIWGAYTTDANDKIISFEPKTAFHAVDYSEFTSAIESLKTIDYVVASQEPTAGNNYTWYRLYKSGWVEQGGYLPATGSGDTLQTVNLPKAMNDAHYTVTTSITDATASFATDWYLVTVQQQTSTGFKTYTGADWGKYWSVSGKASV